MCLRATIVRPLRSKRAMISPVRPRANASGLTRMRVRSTWFSLVLKGLELGRLDGRRLRFLVAPAAAAGGLDRPSDLRLAVRAQRPLRVERLAAGHARVLELAMAVRAAQEVPLDLVVAMRAQQVAELMQPRLGRLHLEFALAHVFEVLRRTNDHVHDRADE